MGRRVEGDGQVSRPESSQCLRAYSLCFLCGVQKCHLPVRLARYI